MRVNGSRTRNGLEIKTESLAGGFWRHTLILYDAMRSSVGWYCKRTSAWTLDSSITPGPPQPWILHPPRNQMQEFALLAQVVLRLSCFGFNFEVRQVRSGHLVARHARAVA
eukprot:183351-Rhodomonas_salina.1